MNIRTKVMFIPTDLRLSPQEVNVSNVPERSIGTYLWVVSQNPGELSGTFVVEHHREGLEHPDPVIIFPTLERWKDLALVRKDAKHLADWRTLPPYSRRRYHQVLMRQEAIVEAATVVEVVPPPAPELQDSAPEATRSSGANVKLVKRHTDVYINGGGNPSASADAAAPPSKPPVPPPLIPVPDFIGVPVNGMSPLTVAFTDMTTNNPTTWGWGFGDGGSSTEQNPVHQYAAPGTYSVSLVVHAAGGDATITKTNYVTVLRPETAVVWRTTVPPLSTLGKGAYALSDADRTITVSLAASGPAGTATVETVATARTTGRRYYELHYGGDNIDMMGFAVGNLYDAGGTIDFLDEPAGMVFVVAHNRAGNYKYWWLRQWNVTTFKDSSRVSPYAPPAANASPRLLPAFNGEGVPDEETSASIIGFDVDLDLRKIMGVYIDGVRVIPDTLTGVDLTAWNDLNSWPVAGNAGPYVYQRRISGDVYITFRGSALDMVGPVPVGSIPWNSA